MRMGVMAESALGSGFAGAKLSQTEPSLGAQLPKLPEIESITQSAREGVCVGGLICEHVPVTRSEVKEMWWNGNPG